MRAECYETSALRNQVVGAIAEKRLEMAPELTEVLFSLLVSYVGALELIFVVKHLYHWIYQHQRHLLQGGSDGETIEEMQERIKAAIEEAKLMEFGDYKAMVDGVLYKDGFRVDPETIDIQKEREMEKMKRQVIGGAENHLEEHLEEVHEEPCVKVVIPPKEKTPAARLPTPDASTPSITDAQRSNTLSEKQIARERTSRSPAGEIQTVNYSESERQAPDGEDHVPVEQYSEDYLRSLDGIKHRPLVRDDGTSHRRAFKKRRSSDDSISSIDSRKSREEEVQMFTSLEEEEFEKMKRNDGDYVPIRYSNDASIKSGKHQKRSKKSPIKDISHNESNKGSFGGLNDEGDPWGEVKPEHYKNSQFWQREKAISIEEERDEEEANLWEKTRSELAPSPKEHLEAGKNVTKDSSFEEATSTQHKEVIESLQKHGSAHSVSENEFLHAQMTIKELRTFLVIECFQNQ